MNYLPPIASIPFLFRNLSFAQKSCLLGLFLSCVAFINNAVQRTSLRKLAASILTSYPLATEESVEKCRQSLILLTKKFFPTHEKSEDVARGMTLPQDHLPSHIERLVSLYVKNKETGYEEIHFNNLVKRLETCDQETSLSYLKVISKDLREKFFEHYIIKKEYGYYSQEGNAFYFLQQFHSQSLLPQNLNSLSLSRIRTLFYHCVILKSLVKDNCINQKYSTEINAFLETMYPPFVGAIRENRNLVNNKYALIECKFLLSLLYPEKYLEKLDAKKINNDMESDVKNHENLLETLQVLFACEFIQILSDNQINSILDSASRNSTPPFSFSSLRKELPYVVRPFCSLLTKGQERIFLALIKYELMHYKDKFFNYLNAFDIPSPLKEPSTLIKIVKIWEGKYFQERTPESFLYIVRTYLGMYPRTEETKKGLTSFLLSHGPSLAMPSLSMLFFVTIYGILGYLKK